jgi:hypothetical protein
MAGRPRIYDNPDELEAQCDSYFVKCDTDKVRPTVTGLALFLGFASKQSLYDYDKEEQFSYPIKKSLTRIENALEQKLENNSVAGVIFALKNMGWKDASQVDQNMNIVWPETRTYPNGSNAKTD